MKRQLTLPIAAAALALAPAAHAHVTLHPNVIPTGQFAEVAIRVPNERQDADTTAIRVRFPAGFVFVSYAPVPGWSTKVVYRKLAQPVTVDGTRHDQEVAEVQWSGGRIAPGQYLDFPLSVAMPHRSPGATLTFKTLQTYSDGEVERWIGPPSEDNPAPQVVLTDEDAAAQDVLAGPVAAPAAATAASDDSTKENLALVLATLATVAGVIALALVLASRRAHR